MEKESYIKRWRKRVTLRDGKRDLHQEIEKDKQEDREPGR